MSDKIVEIGRLFIEIFKTVPSGCRVDIWKGDAFIRPTRRELLVSLTGEESSAILNAINEICGVTEVKPQPQPAPVTLVEVCEDYFDWIDTGCAYATDYKLQGYYNDKVRQALTVEHKRRVLVEIVLEALAVYRKCGYGWRNVGDALDALDAFDKERGV